MDRLGPGFRLVSGDLLGGAEREVGEVPLSYCSVSIGRFITMACSFFMVSR